MKKYLFIVITALTVIFAGTTCLAQTIDSKELGIKFELSDGWKQVFAGEDSITFEYATTGEIFTVEMYEGDSVYPIEYLDWDGLDEVFKKTFGKEHIREIYSENNGGINVNVDILHEESKALKTSTEKYVYAYTREYVVSADGYYDLEEKDIIFYMVENGRQYFLTYKVSGEEIGGEDVLLAIDKMEFAKDYIEIYVDGKMVVPDSAPIIENGRTLVPIRAIVEAMGYDVEWDGETRKVTITNGTTKLEFIIDNEVAYKNSTEEIELDVSAAIYKDRTYIPLRAVGEALSADVVWDGEEIAVNIWWQTSPEVETI